MAKPSRKRYAEMAKAVRRATKRYHKKSMRMFSGDHDLEKMVYHDCIDLRNIAKLINSGSIVKAARAVYDLDTAVRDEVPVQTYNYLYDRYR